MYTYTATRAEITNQMKFNQACGEYAASRRENAGEKTGRFVSPHGKPLQTLPATLKEVISFQFAK